MLPATNHDEDPQKIFGVTGWFGGLLGILGCLGMFRVVFISAPAQLTSRSGDRTKSGQKLHFPQFSLYCGQIKHCAVPAPLRGQAADRV